MFGVLNGLKHAPQFMSDNGAIVNTSSLGLFCISGSGPYSASKAAVLTGSMTQQSFHQKNPGQCSSPGVLKTPLASEDISLFEAVGAG